MLLLFIFTANMLTAQITISDLEVLPENPDSSDSISIVCQSFSSTRCPIVLESYTIDISNFKINIHAYYQGGIWGMQCFSSDTINIGKLNNGNYELIYHLETIDSLDTYIHSKQLDFFVDNESWIQKLKTDSLINIYPNPANQTIKIDLKGNKDINAIKLFSIDGKLIKTYPKSSTLLHISEVPHGQYYLFIRLNDESVVKKKIIII